MQVMDLDQELEGAPTDGQKERLENFLTELMLLTRKYRILLHDRAEEVEMIDLPTGHLIGLGLAWFTAPENEGLLRSAVPVNSILDGTWVIDTPAGPVEQHRVQNVFPVREL